MTYFSNNGPIVSACSGKIVSDGWCSSLIDRVCERGIHRRLWGVGLQEERAASGEEEGGGDLRAPLLRGGARYRLDRGRDYLDRCDPRVREERHPDGVHKLLRDALREPSLSQPRRHG